ncbi:MAG: PKD domain-containing protein, partial [Candidatus Diapherotrites archaeon]|nr:PKD domain-containing protein [Candidatus Diapherotrites archaeon]
DGTNATGNITTHVYTTPGTYTVTLTVTDDDGDSGIDTVTVNVTQAYPDLIISSIATNDSSPEPGQVIQVNVTVENIGHADVVGDIGIELRDGSTEHKVLTDLAVGSSKLVSFTWSNGTPGNYTLIATVDYNDVYQEENETNNNATLQIRVNAPPVADAGSDMTCYTGNNCDFDGTNSTDDSAIVTYYWDFGDGTNATGNITTHVYTTPGTYTVTLTVTDDDGISDSDSINVTVVTNNPPVADAGPDQMVSVNTVVTLDGTNSTDDYGIISYEWDFGDGNTGTGVTTTHNYTAVGLYIVTLTVTDDGGLTDSDSATVAVYDLTTILPDLATNTDSIHTPDVINKGDTVTITADIYNLGGANATNVTIRFYVDGNMIDETTIDVDATTITQAQAVWNVGVNDVGTHTITVSVDPDNNITELDETNNEATKQVQVNDVNLAPVAVITASATDVYTGQTITFDATNSYDPDGTIVSYYWDFGDGTNATGNITTHVYTTPGTYTVTLTVTDNNSTTALDNVTITVSQQTTGGGTAVISHPGGGGGAGLIIEELNKTVKEEEQPKPIIYEPLVTYEMGNFLVTRDYIYDPSTGKAVYTLNVKNIGDERKRVEIEDPAPFGWLAVSPKPERLTGVSMIWEAYLSPGQSIEVTYKADEEIPADDVRAIGPPTITELSLASVPSGETTTEGKTEQVSAENVTTPPASPITGLVTFASKSMMDSIIGIAIFAVIGAIVVLYEAYKEKKIAIDLSMLKQWFSTGATIEEQGASSYQEGTLY